MTGYRGFGHSGFGTEGNGIYIAHDSDVASFFGEVNIIRYKNPRHPLIVNEEVLPILHESDIFLDPINPNDTEWIKMNKQAWNNLGMTDNTWNVEKISEELTRLLKEKGYDAVRVTSAGQTWDVLLDPSLVVSSNMGFKKQISRI